MEFEFCGAELKREEEGDSDDSDDNIPLAAFEKSDNAEKTPIDDSSVAKSGELDQFANRLIRCPKCNKACKSRKKLNAHMRKSHGKKFKCNICTYTTDKTTHLEDHYNVHSGNRPYSCYLCENSTFKTEAALRRHIKKNHSERPAAEKKKFSCDLCGKLLSSAYRLEEHVRLHTGEKPVICKLCGKSFVRDCDLKQHLNLHDEMWKCKVCQKCFSTPFRLKEHSRTHTGELPYECDKCDRKFARVADFRYHVGTHLGVKPYPCGECGARFTTSSSARRHRLNSHEAGPRSFACPGCPKRFFTASRLSAHVKLHEDKKKYKCELCPAARGSPAELHKHALIHGGEFRCDTCHRGFGSAERLASHAARHDIAGKPYACFVCSVGYRTSQSLNKHLATVHRNEDVPKIAPQHLCTLCGQVFELKDKLNRHLKESHVVVAIGEIRPVEDDIDDVPIAPLEDKKAILECEKNNTVIPDPVVLDNSSEIFDAVDRIENKDKIITDNNIPSHGDASSKDGSMPTDVPSMSIVSDEAKETSNLYLGSRNTVRPPYASYYGSNPRTNDNIDRRESVEYHFADIGSFAGAYQNRPQSQYEHYDTSKNRRKLGHYYGPEEQIPPPINYAIAERNYPQNPTEMYPRFPAPRQFFENFRSLQRGTAEAQNYNRAIQPNFPAFSPYGFFPPRVAPPGSDGKSGERLTYSKRD